MPRHATKYSYTVQFILYSQKAFVVVLREMQRLPEFIALNLLSYIAHADVYQQSHFSGEIIITGHESPLIVGLPRDITCTWSGKTNATKMQWFLVGLDAIPIESADNSTSVVLSPDPNTIGLDGAMFTCTVTTYNGRQYEATITLEVKGHNCFNTHL